MPRRLGSDEKALWGRVIETVKPLHVVKPAVGLVGVGAVSQAPLMRRGPTPNPVEPLGPVRGTGPSTPKREGLSNTKPGTRSDNLDGHWDRRIDKGAIVPDVSVDLHGSGLSGAYARLDGALELAIAQKMKVLLLVTGKAGAHDRSSGKGRGAIASVVRDWLAASRHSVSIAAVRGAHPRHGGAGALYIVLKS